MAEPSQRWTDTARRATKRERLVAMLDEVHDISGGL